MNQPRNSKRIIKILSGFSMILFIALGCRQETRSEDADLQPKLWLTFDGKEGSSSIVLISGDEEYRSEEALPQLARILSERHGFNCKVLFSQDPENEGIIDPNYSFNIPGLQLLEDADLMIIFTRFRALPDEQMEFIDDYLKSGKPVIGIRTATHAFLFKDTEIESSFKHYGNYHESDDDWNGGFGRLVLGEKWISHHGLHGDQSTRGIIAPEMEGHPILKGIENGDVWGPTDVYGVRLPLPGDSQPLLLGRVIDRSNDYEENDSRLGMRSTDNKLPELKTLRDGTEIDPNDPMMPIAWIRTYSIPGGQKGKVFTSTIGASVDLLEEGTRRLFVNAVYWSLDLEVPLKGDVDIVGNFQPTRFAFRKDEYWDSLAVSINSLK